MSSLAGGGSPKVSSKNQATGFWKMSATICSSSCDGIEQAIARGLAYAPYADLIWCETSRPDLDEARRFADAIHARVPDKKLAYNCSPSFNWQANLDEATMRRYREELNAMGYKFQFITLAGWHALNLSMFELCRDYRRDGMLGYSRLQQREFAQQEHGFRAARHQAFVGAGYFDRVQQTIMGGAASTTAMHGSTEEEQFGHDTQQADAAAPGAQPARQPSRAPAAEAIEA